MSRLQRVVLVAGTAAMLAGCAGQGVNMQGVPILEARALPDSFEDVEGGQVPAARPNASGPAAWWRQAGDPVLDRIVQQSLSANLDVAQAAARLSAALARSGQARGAMLPTLGATLGGSRVVAQGPDVIASEMAWSGQLSLGWDPDLFGRLSNGRKSAAAELTAAGYDLAEVRRALLIEIVTAYVSYRALEARLINADRALGTQQETLDAVERRYRLGLAVETDRQQARLQLLQVRGLIPQVRDQRNQSRNRIATLIGVTPVDLGGLIEGPAVVPVLSELPPMGLPADLIRRRPDVMAAENRVIAAAAQIGVAKAALLPQLTLSGVLDVSSPSLGGIFDSLIATTFGRIAQTLFNGGQGRASVREKRAVAQEALAAYRARLLASVEDVENGLSAVRTGAERVVIGQEAVDAAQQAAAQARRQHDLGLIDFYVLLAAEQALLQQRDDLVAAQADRSIAVARLNAALGS